MSKKKNTGRPPFAHGWPPPAKTDKSKKPASSGVRPQQTADAPATRPQPERRVPRVPGQDAFDTLPRRRPPNLPGYEQDKADYELEREAAAREREAQRADEETASGGKREARFDRKRRAGYARSAEKRPPERSHGPAGGRETNAPGDGQEDAPRPDRKQKQREKRAQHPVNPMRRRRNRRIAGAVGIVVLIAAGVWLCFGVLFKIDGFSVSGDSPYAKEEIVAAFGPREGDNMFGFSADGEAERIQQMLPYIERVTIRRRLPGTVVFQVQAAAEKYSMAVDDGHALLNDARKVLAVREKAPADLVEIRGLEDATLQPGFILSAPADGGASADGSANASSGSGGTAAPTAEATTQERMALLETLLTALDESGLEDVTWVDVGDPLDLRFCWQDRITVKLGGKGDLAEKLAFVVVLFTDPERGQIASSDKGVLDMSIYPDIDRVWLSPG